MQEHPAAKYVQEEKVMKKKIVSVLLTAAMTASLVTGCGGSTTGTADATSKAQESSAAPAADVTASTAAASTESAAAASTASNGEKTKLEFWNVFTGTDGEILKSIVDDYNANNKDNITIDMQIMPNDTFQEKLPAAIATGTAPDFVLCGVENIAPYVANDSLEDISDFWQTTGVDKDNFSENVVDLSYVGDKLYGTPMQYNVMYLYWNKDLFKAAGLDPETPPKTLDEMADYAVKLTDSSKNQFGLALPTSNTYMQFLWANGGDADDPATNKNLLNSDANLKTLEWMQDLAVTKKVTPQNITGSDGDTMFQAGQVAMYMNGPWLINGLNELGLNYGVGEVPAGSAGAFSPAGGCSFMIPKGTEDSQRLAAYKFMQYWLTDDVLKTWSTKNGFPVWSKTLMNDPDITANKTLSSVSQATECGRSYNLGYSLASQIDSDVMVPMFESVITGTSKPQDALQKASDAMDKVLASSSK